VRLQGRSLRLLSPYADATVVRDARRRGARTLHAAVGRGLPMRDTMPRFSKLGCHLATRVP